jgi:hypothetical protein
VPTEPTKPSLPLTQDRRRAIFAAVVAAQDAGSSVPDARSAVGARYRVTESQVRSIEREGVDKGWPPL